MLRLLFCGTCLTLALVVAQGSEAGSQDKKDQPKYTIKDVMKKAHGKNGLLNKVKGGTASADDTKLLLEMYVALSKDKPPQGDAASWKMKTGALVDSVTLIVNGKKDDGIIMLGKAANCKACHSVHKG